MPPDVFKNIIQFLHDLIIPVPYYTNPLRTKEMFSGFVALDLMGVLIAIEFDNQFLIDAGEIDDVLPYRILSPEFVTVYLSAA